MACVDPCATVPHAPDQSTTPSSLAHNPLSWWLLFHAPPQPLNIASARPLQAGRPPLPSAQMWHTSHRQTASTPTLANSSRRWKASQCAMTAWSASRVVRQQPFHQATWWRGQKSLWCCSSMSCRRRCPLEAMAKPFATMKNGLLMPQAPSSPPIVPSVWSSRNNTVPACCSLRASWRDPGSGTWASARTLQDLTHTAKQAT